MEKKKVVFSDPDLERAWERAHKRIKLKRWELGARSV